MAEKRMNKRMPDSGDLQSADIFGFLHLSGNTLSSNRRDYGPFSKRGDPELMTHDPAGTHEWFSGGTPLRMNPGQWTIRYHPLIRSHPGREYMLKPL